MKKIFFVLLLLFNITIVHAINVSSFDELVDAVNNGEQEIKIINDITYNDTISITSNIKINGNDKKMSRDSSFTGTLFNVTDIGSLEIENLTIDGGAPGWKMDYDNRYYTGANQTGYSRTPTITDDNDLVVSSSMISNLGKIVLNNVSMQNARSTANGSAINGNGIVEINNSTFKHMCSSMSGGAIFMDGGKISFTSSVIEDNVAGCKNASAIYGGFIYIKNADLIKISDDTIFKDNYAQENGGALYIANTNIDIKNTNFIHNMVGNDGAAITIIIEKDGLEEIIQDTLFKGNMGFAMNGQSMGTIWLDVKNNNDNKVFLLKNTIFTENIVSNGGAIANRGNKSNVRFENVEASKNNVLYGGFLYCQRGEFFLKNVNIHDNESGRGGIIYNTGCSIEIDGSTITKNKSSASGGAISNYFGPVIIKNTKITYNESLENKGGGIFISGYYSNANPKLIVENSIITNNKAKISGGGIAVRDYGEMFSSITIDDKTKIVDNHAEEAGDDFVYMRENDIENPNGKTISLNNISIAGLIGVDGWYKDEQDDRFLDTESPTKFNDFKHYDGYQLYLKAAGISSIDYDLNGGNNKNIAPIKIRYGQIIKLNEETPIKEGYKFIEWNTKADGTGKSIKPGDVYDGKEGLMLYAIYEELPVEKEPDVEKHVEVIDNPETTDKILLCLVLFFLGLIIIRFINNKVY